VSAGAEANRQLVGRRDQPLQLVQCPARHQHLLPRTEHRRGWQVTDREPVRVGRHHLHTGVLGRQEHTGEHGARVVGARGTDHLAQGVGDLRARKRHRLGVGLDLRGVVGQRQRSHGELRPPGADAQLVVAERDLHPTARERLHDVGHQPCRHHDGAVAITTDGDLESDGELEIGADDGQQVIGEVQTQTRQDGQRAGAARGRPPGGGERVGQDISFATELHGAALLLDRLGNTTVVVVGAVDWGQPDDAAA
jgi:hypothetical protein